MKLQSAIGGIFLMSFFLSCVSNKKFTKMQNASQARPFPPPSGALYKFHRRPIKTFHSGRRHFCASATRDAALSELVAVENKPIKSALHGHVGVEIKRRRATSVNQVYTGRKYNTEAG